MRHQDFLELGTAKSLRAFEAGLVSFARKLEFELLSAALVTHHSGQAPVFLTLGNTPTEFIQASKNKPNARRDPVLKRLKTLNIPFIYDQQLYAEEGAGDLWEEQARFGYHAGISVGLHLANDRHFLLGVDRSKPLPTDDARLTQLMGYLQLLAVHAQDAAQRLMQRSPLEHDDVSLTPREIEVLRLTMEGMTSTRIAERLSVTVAGVQYHLANVRRKFAVDSKHQAVLRALSMGLI